MKKHYSHSTSSYWSINWTFFRRLRFCP